MKHKVLRPDGLHYDVNGHAQAQAVKETTPPTTQHLRRYGRYWAVYDAPPTQEEEKR
jgi:hypothetical protein